MKSKRGFTLIELIAVIVILAIILVIGTLSIQRFITKGRNKSFDVLVNSFQDSAKTAYTECILKPNSDFCGTHPVPDYNESVTVTLGELIDAEFSDVLKNPWKTSEECDRNSTVTLTRKQDSQIVFDYETCLICGDHKTCEGENGGGENNNPEPVPITPIPSPSPDPEPAGPTIGVLREMILEDYPDVHTNPTLTNPSSNTNNPSGLYSMSVTGGYGGSDGTTYYFRGNVRDNNVIFAGHTWQIVRINEDGTVRLILDGSTDDKPHVFNKNYKDYTYMYYSNSEIKKDISNWFDENITGNDLAKVASGKYFCEAAKVKLNNDYTYGNATATTYSAYRPNLTCAKDSNGYGPLTRRVGLITYDEALLAGGYPNRGSKLYYLWQPFNFWTMSPAGFYLKKAHVWHVHLDGYFATFYCANALRIRPVINLKTNTMAYRDGEGHYVVVD